MSVSFDFSGKKVLVTGGSKGIGRAIAGAFLKSHAEVAVCARGAGELNSLQKEHLGLKLVAISADASKEEEIKQTLEKVVHELNGLDILINNVGGAIQFGNFWELTNQAWVDAFELNVLSMVHFSKHASVYLKKSTSPRIINISSISGVEPGFYNPHYTTTKAGAMNFSKYLANVLAPEGILVNCVCPGSVETDSWEKSLEQIALERKMSKEEVRREQGLKEVQKIPLGRMGQGEDVASLVLFLASHAANWITGSCFHVNGGKMRAMC